MKGTERAISSDVPSSSLGFVSSPYVVRRDRAGILWENQDLGTALKFPPNNMDLGAKPTKFGVPMVLVT